MTHTRELTEELIRLMPQQEQIDILDGLVRDGLITSYTVQTDDKRYLTVVRKTWPITDTMTSYGIDLHWSDDPPVSKTDDDR